MIRYTPASQRSLSLFKTPFEQSLSPDNRWVRMADFVPWDKMARVFFEHLSANHGRPTVDLRIILGALMVKYIEKLSDEDTIEYIQENVYAQYFVGLSSFQSEPVFVPSLFVEIRKRLGKKGAKRLNNLMIKQARLAKVVKHRKKTKKPPQPPLEQPEENPISPASDQNSSPVQDNQIKCSPAQEAAPTNRGELILDATVAPLDLAYPTDSKLLNDGREHSEQLIDILYTTYPQLWPTKPRTYRQVACKQYVSFSKKRKKTKKDIRKAVGQQLRYLRRNIKILNRMLDQLQAQSKPLPWTFNDWRLFWIIQELYRQQNTMYRDGRRRIDDRLISIQQPHARPIKRGKGGAKDTEFGPKINVSCSEGILSVDQIDFNAFNESTYLKDQIEGYKALYGYYPALVLADQIYWTRENRKYLKDKGIETGAPPLGRKPQRSKYERERDRKRNNKRSQIEGKFGEAKNKYGLDRLQTRLPETTMAEIQLIFLAMNLKKVARAAFYALFKAFQQLDQDKVWTQIQQIINQGFNFEDRKPQLTRLTT